MHLSVQQMTSLPVSVLVLGIGIARHQSIGYLVLGAKLGIVLTLLMMMDQTDKKHEQPVPQVRGSIPK